MKELEDVCSVQVRFSEIDSMRRVWHGSYVIYFEDGRESFGRHYPGIGYADMQRAGIYAPVYELRAKYYAPLSLMNGQRFTRTMCINWGPAWITFTGFTGKATIPCVRKEVPLSCSSTCKES